MKDFSRLIQQCEEWIRSGQLANCASALQKLNGPRVPSNYRRELAVIARRIGQPQMGLRLMTPMFRAGFEDARPSDLAEYAVLLQRCGANREALSLLAGVSEQQVPEVSLYRAFAHFNLWDYERAVPHLVNYIGADISPYWRLVGRVNLADAFLFTEKYDAAEFLLEELAGELRSLKHNRLLGNCFEMLGQLHILRGNLQKAADPLAQAAGMLGQAGSLDWLYVSRWQSVLESLKSKNPAALNEFRAHALKKGEFESVRQADFFRLKVSFDAGLFKHLYTGTPYAAYREKLARAFGGAPGGESYVWGPAGGRRFDVANAAVDNAPSEIKGLKPHAFLAELSRDFYKPMRTAEIFSALWPNEHFNVFSSPQRVHQVAARTRRWLVNEKLDLQIERGRFGYKINFGETVGLEISAAATPVLAYERYLHDLKTKSPKGFTQRHARENLGLSASAIRRFCSWAVQNGRVEKFGASAATKYLFPETAISAA